MNLNTDNLRIHTAQEVIAPATLSAECPITETAARTVVHAREAVQSILKDADDRLLVVIGPCSIHDVDAARDYASRLKVVMHELKDELYIIMRVYFEKPRTTVGWKGLINDPGLDGSFRINDGLRIARRLLVDLNEMGVPAGTEFLDPISPQYVADLIAWGAIGARTTESQVHRELASGLSCPIGFKNATDGGIQIAVDAVVSAQHPHHFLGVTPAGRTAILATTGNPDGHIILRGGKEPNFDAPAIEAAAGMMVKGGLSPRLVVDVSHANSRKQHALQLDAARDVAGQIAGGERRIKGVMVESHLVAGRQNQEPGKPLTYGQSITDACLGWDDSALLLGELAAAVRARRARGLSALQAPAA
jgi:3-deoxy-7-phosphoheptulonate synthase